MMAVTERTQQPSSSLPLDQDVIKPRIRRRLTSTVHHKTADNNDTVTKDVTYVSFLCGISAGVLQAGLFNPWDRALYLSISKQTPFLSRENFRNPYLGFFQSVGHRALSGGLYYPLENVFCSMLLPFESQIVDNDKNSMNYCNMTNRSMVIHPGIGNFLAGTLAGTCNALIVNPISAIKYKSWGREVNRGMATEAVEMFEKGGLRPFGNGLLPTVYRDLVFGGTYTFLRLELQYRLELSQDKQWTANMAAAAMATIVSGPFNLARNVQYATRSKHKADNVSKVLHDFVVETQQQSTLWGKMRFVQNRLRIGWGTVRVAVGMSFGHFVYDRMLGMYEDHQVE
ncbi:mitochondrial carrier protein [Nitzschia inconspicua]|uniref:Mitochondrial carrier protein n=1 Tax=Nitzschia inconspicua TaxID=303405 RepID=A0A9K3Q7E8_9STRA|nr:mitochondrial carrier protein [Nitzschia inconspicua]